MKFGILFDLDGVLVSTDEYHYLAWKQMADEEGIYFDRAINERLRGVSRMQSLEIILEKAPKSYSDEQKAEMASRKNAYYGKMILQLTSDHLLPGAAETLHLALERKIPIAIASSSKNTRIILHQIGLEDTFQAIIDGNCISRSKPDPEVFLKAAEALKLSPKHCLVVEDADAGVDAGLAGGMRVLGVGSASENPKASFHAQDLAHTDWTMIFQEMEALS